MGDQQLWERVVGGHFVLAKRSFWPNFFSQVVARLQWNPAAIDLTADAAAWPELPPERRRRLLTLLAGFCVAEDAVAVQLTPFADAAREAKLASRAGMGPCQGRVCGPALAFLFGWDSDTVRTPVLPAALGALGFAPAERAPEEEGLG